MLSFTLGSIPIRIQLSFWLTAAFLGVNERDPLALAVWIGVVFLSVLLHELGHALMGKAFGLEPQIELYAFGGATAWGSGSKLPSWQRILVSLAGPMTGLAVIAVLWLASPFLGVRAELYGLSFLVAPHGISSSALFLFLQFMFYTNWFWSIFNLLPILPLDGGNVMAHAFAAATGGGGRRAAHIISIAVAILMAVWLFLSGRGGILAAVWLGLFALQNFRALQPPSAAPPARQRW